MYAIVQLGSAQYKVQEGDSIKAPLMKEKEGKSITLDKVLLFANGKTIKTGQPYLKDVKVAAKVLRHLSGKKVITFKYRRRKDSAQKIGHRQKLTQIQIAKISVDK